MRAEYSAALCFMRSGAVGCFDTLPSAMSFTPMPLPRCAGHVLTEGNTLLADEELGMLVILRMNRDFMQFMHKHYNHLSKNHFGKIIVDAALPGDKE